MKGLFDDQTVPIKCPNCGHETPRSIVWLKAHTKFACPCGAIVEIDAGQFREEIVKADRAFESFKRRMESIGNG